MTLDQIEKIMDSKDFWVHKYDDMFGAGEPGWEFGQMTPCGEDWIETVESDDADTLLNSLIRRLDGWDSEEEAKIWFESAGKNGVPGIRDLLDDADWKEETLRDLVAAIQEAPDEEDEIEESKKQEWKETSSDEFGDIETNKYYEIEVDDGFLDDRFDSEKAAVEFARKQKGDVRIYVNGSEKYTSGEYKGQSEPLEGILVWERVNGKERSASNFDPKRENKKVKEGVESEDLSNSIYNKVVKIVKANFNENYYAIYYHPSWMIQIEQNDDGGFDTSCFDSVKKYCKIVENARGNMLTIQIIKNKKEDLEETENKRTSTVKEGAEPLIKGLKKVIKESEDDVDLDKLANEVEPTKLDEIITEWEAKSPLHERIIEEIIDDSEGYDGDKLAQIKGRLGDISYGLVNGTVGSLIYYDDTNKFFEEYYDDIWDVVQEWSEQGVEPLEALKRNCDETEIIMGSDNFKCWVVWMVYEEIAYLFGEALDEINSEEKVSA